jgi:hypothetical protein
MVGLAEHQRHRVLPVRRRTPARVPPLQPRARPPCVPPVLAGWVVQPRHHACHRSHDRAGRELANDRLDHVRERGGERSLLAGLELDPVVGAVEGDAPEAIHLCTRTGCLRLRSGRITRRAGRVTSCGLRAHGVDIGQ